MKPSLLLLRRLSTGRWMVPILAAMDGEPGSRFGVIAERLQVSRTILSRSLEALERFGWIERNAGHGHPLRPEYLLTAQGRQMAAWCSQVIEQRDRLALKPQHLGRWSMPLLFELYGSWRRFSILQERLTPVTPRALTLALRQMGGLSLVDRRPETSPSNILLYGLTDRGHDLASAIVGGSNAILRP